MDIHFFQPKILKDYSFPLLYLFSFLANQLTVYMWIYLWTLLMSSTGLFVYLGTNTILSRYLLHVYKPGRVSPLIFFQRHFDYTMSFHFHLNFRIWSSIFRKKFVRILIDIALNLCINFEMTDILTLYLLIHEHMHLFIYLGLFCFVIMHWVHV